MRKELRHRLTEYRAQIMAADPEEVLAIRSKFYEWYDLVSDEDKAEARPFWDGLENEIWEMINETKDLIEELRKLNEEELAEARK